MILTFLGSNFPNFKIWPFKIGENSKFGHNHKSRHFRCQKVLKMEILNPWFCLKHCTILKNCLDFGHCTSLWLLQSPLPRLYYPLHSLQNGPPRPLLPLNLRPPTKKISLSFLRRHTPKEKEWQKSITTTQYIRTPKPKPSEKESISNKHKDAVSKIGSCFYFVNNYIRYIGGALVDVIRDSIIWVDSSVLNAILLKTMDVL